MSLIHWSRSLGIRAVCGKAKGSESYQGTAQQYLGVSNFCRVCEKIAKQDVDAQKMLAGLGTGKAQLAIVQQWPDPRPIAEAPKLECILAYVPTSSDPHLEGRWLLMAATEDKGKIDGFTVIGARPDADRWFPCSILQPTHFFPLPPAPEVRK